ncbi:RNA polymerase sigma factor [Engelhardtia mirabilis]
MNRRNEAAYEPPSMECQVTRLMTAAKAGDRHAFDELVAQLRGRAFQVASSMVGSRDDALDLSQETFMKVYRARETFREDQPFLPWFHRILRNTCFSFLRKTKRLKRSSLDAHDEDESPWEIVDEGPSPSRGAEIEEVRTLFERAMSEMKPRDREILTLRHTQELSYREIAEALSIPEGTVMSRLFHARRRLRDQLGPLLGETEDPTPVAAPPERPRPPR